MTQNPNALTIDPSIEWDRDDLLAALRARLGERVTPQAFTEAVDLLVVERQLPRESDLNAVGRIARPSRALMEVLDHLPVGVAAVGPDLQPFAFNKKARALLDFPDHLFAGGLPHFSELIRFNARRGEYGPGDPDEITASAVERARQMQPHRIERTRPGGFVLDIRGESLPGGGFVTIWTDITALKLAERSALEREQALRLVTDNLPGTMAFLDTELRYRFANRQLLAMLGKTNLGEIAGCDLRDVVGAQVDAEIRVHFERALKGERSTYRRTLRSPQGEPNWLQVLVTPHTDEHGQVLGVYAVGSDVTAQMRAEASLQQRNAELEALNKEIETAHTQLLQSEKLASIGQLAAGIAHEINNPVGYVLSNFSSLEHYVADLFCVVAAYEEVEPLLPEQGDKIAALRSAKKEADLDYLKEDMGQLLAESHDGLQRVKKIVQDLKDFSRAGQDQGWELADLSACLDSALNIANNEIKYKAQLVKEYGEVPAIECLPSQLNQVFLNMLVNAGHAIKEHGTITVRTGAADDERVWVDIIDSGCGIAPDIIGRIFDPFFTTKPVGTGTGLGLALSYGIVQKHQGKIDVESRVGEGSRFRIWLPTRQPARPVAGP